MFSWLSMGAAPANDNDSIGDGPPPAPAQPAPPRHMRVVPQQLSYRAELIIDTEDTDVHMQLPAPPTLLPWGTIVTELYLEYVEYDSRTAHNAAIRLCLDHEAARTLWTSDSAVPLTYTCPAAPAREKLDTCLFRQEIEQEMRQTIATVAAFATEPVPHRLQADVDAARARFLFAPTIGVRLLLTPGAGRVRARLLFGVRTSTLRQQPVRPK